MKNRSRNAPEVPNAARKAVWKVTGDRPLAVLGWARHGRREGPAPFPLRRHLQGTRLQHEGVEVSVCPEPLTLRKNEA